MATNLNVSNWPINDGLRVGHLNICHLINKISDVSKIIYNNNKPFHIFGFSETWTDSHITDSLISIPGYDIIRRNPVNPQQTGIVIYVQNNISCKIRSDLSHSKIESVWLEMHFNNKSTHSILVGFIYRHPKSLSSWYDDFCEMMDTVWLSGQEVLLLGDLNIDLFQTHSQWRSIIRAYNLNQCVTLPTRVTSKSSTLIDHIYSSDITCLREVCVPSIGISDHNAVCVTWNKAGFKMPKTSHVLITFRSFKNFKLHAFHSDLASTPFSNIYSFTDADNALSFWIAAFLSVVDKHIPLIQRRVKSQILPGWLTQEILQAMNERDHFKKAGLEEEYKKKRNIVKYMIRKSKRCLFRKLVQDKSNGRLIWTAIRQLTEPCTSSKECPIPVDVVNNHFANIGGKLIGNDSKSSSFDSTILEKFCNKKVNKMTFSIPLLSINEVLSYLLSLKNKNSCGFDGISPKILKLSAPYIADSLTYLYNLCLSKHYFPKLFKHAKVIPLHKKGDTNDVNNYRPISLLSSISKPLERHVHHHLSFFVESNKLLHVHQSGFRKHHSCETALCRIVDSWLHEINSSKAVGVIFIDLTKAFDLINHKILIQKLRLYGMDENTIMFFTSYLLHRTQSVYARGIISSEKCVPCGVPQGSILGPLLFSLYINDLPLSIQSVVCDLFADDTSLHYASHSIDEINHFLNKSMKSVEFWCETNDMLVHPDKTESMLLCTRQKRQTIKVTKLKLFYKNSIIKQVTKHKLLGVVIDENLLWQEHIHDLTKQISSYVFQLSQIKNFLDEHSRKVFYFAFIQARLDYCSVVWGKCAPSNLKPLNSLQKRALKLIGNVQLKDSPTDNIFKSLQILPLRLCFTYNILILMHKVVYEACPEYLKTMFSFQHQHESDRAVVPKPNIDLFKMSFSYSGSKEWNTLPATCRKIPVLSRFKTEIKLLLFDTCD